MNIHDIRTHVHIHIEKYTYIHIYAICTTLSCVCTTVNSPLWKKIGNVTMYLRHVIFIHKVPHYTLNSDIVIE